MAYTLPSKYVPDQCHRVRYILVIQSFLVSYSNPGETRYKLRQLNYMNAGGCLNQCMRLLASLAL